MKESSSGVVIRGWSECGTEQELHQNSVGRKKSTLREWDGGQREVIESGSTEQCPTKLFGTQENRYCVLLERGCPRRL